MHEDKHKDIANMEMMEALLGLMSRQFLWKVVQSPLQIGESPVQSGDRDSKVAIARSK